MKQTSITFEQVDATDYRVIADKMPRADLHVRVFRCSDAVNTWGVWSGAPLVDRSQSAKIAGPFDSLMLALCATREL